VSQTYGTEESLVNYPPHVNGNGHPVPPRRTSRSQPVEQGTTEPSAPGQAAPQPQLPPLEVLAAQFEAVLMANQQKFADLAAQGVAPDPLYLVHARINHLIDQIAAATGPNGPRWGLMTRLGFEQTIAAELEQAGPQTARMQLAEGARYTPAMISELARQTGTFRRPQ
jgi:hypothetical protein